MSGQDSTIAMNKSQPGTADLPGIRTPSQLMDGFHGVEHSARGTRVGIRHQPAVCVARESALQTQFASCRCGTRFSAFEKTNGFEFHRERDRERVVDFRNVDVRRFDPSA